MEKEKKTKSEAENNEAVEPNDPESHQNLELVHGEPSLEADHVKAAADAIASAQREAEVAQKEMLYLRAEFENYKKRMIREHADSLKLANKNLLGEFLGVVDLLDRALSHSGVLKVNADQEVKNFVSGIEMTRQEVAQLLGRFGVEFVGAIGEKFDPEKHEAISQQETTEDKVDTVLQVFQKGALYQGKLLKPARVVVGKK